MSAVYTYVTYFRTFFSSASEFHSYLSPWTTKTEYWPEFIIMDASSVNFTVRATNGAIKINLRHLTHDPEQQRFLITLQEKKDPVSNDLSVEKQKV